MKNSQPILITQEETFRNIRYHLDKFNNFETLESQVNLALKSQVLPRIIQGKLKLAIDLNLIPYYGEPSEEEKLYIYRSQAKQGTCSFYAYATLYCIKKGKRLTLAMRGVRPTDTSVAIISYLLADVNCLNLDFKTLYLDRGFFSRAVIRWLKALKIPLKTTNKKPIIRLLFIGISFVLVNIWVNLLWRKVSIPRRGGRLILGHLFTFKQMLSFLRSAVDNLYEVVDKIYLVEG